MLDLALSPARRWHPVHTDEVGSLAALSARRMEEAFAESSARGLLALASADLLQAALPPGLGFAREIAKLFFAKVCAVPDLGSAAGAFDLPPPEEELGALLLAAPPIIGGEYLDAVALRQLWDEMCAEAARDLAGFDGTPADWLHAKSPAWNVVGRVCLHLAENKRTPETPFAFLATYATRVSADGRVQHAPLGRAVEEYAGARDRKKLLALLEPLHRAAGASDWLRALVDSGDVFHPLAWTPRDAYALLKDVPALEASGLVVRLPDWWRARRPLRARVEATVGARAPSQLGLDAMLDFRVDVTLDGEKLSAAERKAILASTDGLVLLKGKWVEVDGARLREALDHWKVAQQAAARDGLSFVDAMRLLARVPDASTDQGAAAVAAAEWSTVVAGPWLERVLDELRDPATDRGADPGKELRATLRPYQRQGVAWLLLLAEMRLGACLADDMGLGKTIQVIGLLLLLRRRGAIGPHLLVVPASLLGNWVAELERFAPTLRRLVVHPSAIPASAVRTGALPGMDDADVVLTTYGTVARSPWMRERELGVLVLDEAQAIKNPGAKQTRAVKALRARSRVVLTGTPIENRLGDLWSLFDFVNPGLLGSAEAFRGLVKKVEASPQQGFAALRSLVRPYILRRMKSDKAVVADLPDKTELAAFCSLTKTQAALYQQAVDELAAKLDRAEGIERRGVVLAFLLRFKQICNHPSQWLGDGKYRQEDSGKLARLRELCEPIAERQQKALVFTQFREMTEPLARFLEGVFGRPGLVLHGGTAVKKRAELVAQFQDDLGPPFFVLSVKAGGTGLNLTAASHVIHFDRWWNPAVENQATDRAYRIGQHKNVLVHKFVCRGTIEERVDAMIEAKKGLADGLFTGDAEVPLTELSKDEILRLVSLDIRSALDEG